MRHFTLTLALLLGLGAAATVPERGVRHPGGLHTAADFERIRQQLAEGNERVTAAYNVLASADYAQATVTSYPTETIYRGSNENYINAARGASMAYQNALRWQIEGNTDCADNAVSILMAWAQTTTAISGTSDQCLAVGLYGYEFAQAAELMRDYDGWSASDFQTFRQWMLDLWYPKAIGFLRERNGTWANTSKWWQAPGHYWSNWGLCNALCVLSIGVLCDDVHIYNQGLSFVKHDQVGTFVDPRPEGETIYSDGLTEFWGNLIVTTASFDGAPYGRIGQMQESGRDTGHPAMALGLAVDIAQMCFNQGDDLFAYMDNRLAAGIEYVAMQTQSVEDLPWTPYHYYTNGYYWTDSRSWLMTEPCLGVAVRPYWGTVIGHYEGVKGVAMPYSELALEAMGIDGGGAGSTSGGYDHLGYSVLMHTRDGIAAIAPTLLTPYIIVGQDTLQQAELGGLVNTYVNSGTSAAETGQSLTLFCLLPDGEEDTGLWTWSTPDGSVSGSPSLDITTDRSYAYRLSYVNAEGAESEQLFSIAAEGDCERISIKQTYTIGASGTETEGNNVVFDAGDTITLSAKATDWDAYEWVGTNTTTSTLTLRNVSAERTVQAIVTNPGGRRDTVSFYLWAKGEADDRLLESGNYTIRHRATGQYVASDGLGSAPYLTDAAQEWYVYRSSQKHPYYELRHVDDGSTLNPTTGLMVSKLYERPMRIEFLEDTAYASVYDKNGLYWQADGEGQLDTSTATAFAGYAFEVEAVVSEGIASTQDDGQRAFDASSSYDLSGRRTGNATRGISIVGGQKFLMK